MFTVEGANSNLVLENITLDGDRTLYTYEGNGGIVCVNNGLLSIGEEATLRNSKVSGNGGAVYVERGAAAALGTGSLTGDGAAIRSCEASKGGAVYLNGTDKATSGGGELTIGSGATVADCTATTTKGDGGAGIYLYEGSRLYLSGAPVFENTRLRFRPLPIQTAANRSTPTEKHGRISSSRTS